MGKSLKTEDVEEDLKREGNFTWIDHIQSISPHVLFLNRVIGVDEVRDGVSVTAATLKYFSLSSALSRIGPWLCKCRVRRRPCQAPWCLCCRGWRAVLNCSWAPFQRPLSPLLSSPPQQPALGRLCTTGELSPAACK